MKTFNNLKHAIGNRNDIPVLPSWNEVISELYFIISNPLSLEGEELLLEIIRYNGEVHINQKGDLPHSLSPNNMLKFLAIQGLVNHTGTKYKKDIESVECTGLF